MKLLEIPETNIKEVPSLVALKATDDLIVKLQEELNNLLSKREDILQWCIETGVKQQGQYYLHCKRREVRKVVVELFKEKFPDAYKELKSRQAKLLGREIDRLVDGDLTEIGTKDAEELVGRIPLQPATIPNVYEKYLVTIIPEDRE